MASNVRTQRSWTRKEFFRLHRLRPDHPRPYRTVGYPWVPLAFLVASVAMLLNALVRQPLSTLFRFGIILAGIPGYVVWRAVVSGERGAD